MIIFPRLCMPLLLWYHRVAIWICICFPFRFYSISPFFKDHWNVEVLLESLKIHVCTLVQCAVHNKDHQNDEKVLNLTASVNLNKYLDDSFWKFDLFDVKSSKLDRGLIWPTCTTVIDNELSMSVWNEVFWFLFYGMSILCMGDISS